jgi:hypothetical protein
VYPIAASGLTGRGRWIGSGGSAPGAEAPTRLESRPATRAWSGLPRGTTEWTVEGSWGRNPRARGTGLRHFDSRTSISPGRSPLGSCRWGAVGRPTCGSFCGTGYHRGLTCLRLDRCRTATRRARPDELGGVARGRPRHHPQGNLRVVAIYPQDRTGSRELPLELEPRAGIGHFEEAPFSREEAEEGVLVLCKLEDSQFGANRPVGDEALIYVPDGRPGRVWPGGIREERCQETSM